MANALRGEASFEADGRTYRLLYIWNAAAEFEEVAGRPLSDALLDVAREKLSAKSLRAMLWAGLREHHGDVTLQEAGRLIDRIGRREAQRVMGVALRYFFPELEATEGRPPDPPKPAGGP